MTMRLEDHIRSIPDFPKPGILFRDITTLLSDSAAFREAVRQMADAARELEVDVIAAAEARGFLFAAPLALELGVGLVPIRKPGKLPGETITYTYELEYGSDTLQMHTDAVRGGARVLLIDDLLATGGTIEACARLVEKAGATVVGCVFLIELVGLGGVDKLAKYPCYSIVKYQEC